MSRATPSRERRAAARLQFRAYRGPVTPTPDLVSIALAARAIAAPDARVAIAGVSGAGKTTLATRLSFVAGIPHTELDALHWGPDWTTRPEFMDDVRELVARDRWITEWQYRAARATVIERATLLVWLDVPFSTTLARAVRRTVRRRIRDEELWNGNREPGIRHAVLRPDGVIRWAISTRRKYRALVAATRAKRPELPVLRLRTQRDVEALIDAVSTTQD